MKDISIADNISDLLKKGAIEKCNSCKGQFISSFFLRPKFNKSWYILNLEGLNEFVFREHFELEVVVKIIEKDCFMSTIDLKYAYYLISIDKPHRKYLRFIFEGEVPVCNLDSSRLLRYIHETSKTAYKLP